MKIPYTFIFIFGIFILFISSCKKDRNEVSEDKFSLIDSENGVALLYDIKSSQFTRLSNPQDSNLLTMSEKTLLLPEISESIVQFELGADGEFAGEIEMIPRTSVYPTNVIGRKVTPEEFAVAKMSFTNTSVAYYNKNNELFQADGFCQRLSNYYIQLSNQLTEKVFISPEAFDMIMAAWADAGYEVTENGDYSSIKFDLPNGNYTYVLVDIEKQSIVGTSHYKNDGSLISKSVSYLQDDATNNSSRINSLYVTPFKAPFSEVDMEIVIQSEISNIIYNTIL